MSILLTSTRLGLIACRSLARAYYEQRWMTAPQLAARYNMNVRALMPALRGLKKAGILHSQVGGKTPGFIFSKPPTEVMVHDVIVALEDRYESPCCKELISGLNCDCGRSSECKLRLLFDDIIDQTMQRLKATSVADYSQLKTV